MAVRAAILVLLALLGATAALAGSGRVAAPVPPKGKGEACVAETDFMRRYHMTVLDHQRDDTVHKGVRTKRFSLKACIACHAVAGADARPVGFEDPKHFCRTCHDYAAVSIDCFECHAARPGAKSEALSPDAPGAAALAGYLKGAGR